MKKIFLFLGIGLVVFILVIFVVVGLNLGTIVKLGIEQLGPKVTQVSIKVDAVDVSLLTGSAAIKGFVLGNPQGFLTPQAISVGAIAVSLDPSTVMSSKIVIHSVQVQNPEITFEGGLMSTNNLSKILDNVKAFSNSGESTNSNDSSNSNPTTASNNKPTPKIEIDDFLISGAMVHVHLSNIGSKDIALPDIHLTDLGKGSDGLTPAELTQAVLNAISSDTLKAVTSSVGNLSQSLQDLTKGKDKAVINNVGKITSSLGSLLGK